MSRKGYHLLSAKLQNSDNDDDADDEKQLFDPAKNSNTGDGWSDDEQNLNIFADDFSSKDKRSKNMESVELRPRNSANSSMQEIVLGAPSSEIGSRRSNGSGNNNNGTVLLERRVRRDDTLQKISLQFGVPVAELKRVNGFIADTDLFARDIIKIPVSKHGYNHALIMAELNSDNGAPSSNSVITADSAAEIVPSNASISAGEPVHADHLLKTVDANVQKAQRQLEQRQQQNDIFNADNGLDDDAMLGSRFIPANGINSRSRNSAHWLERNVRHFLAIVLIIFVVIGFPALYFLYKFSESHGQSNASSNNHSQNKN